MEYLAGDDGNHEAGWWKKRLIANNKTRYILKTLSGGVVVIDRATGLMWAANGLASGCDMGNTEDFADRISYANSLVFAGFNDWRVPNIKELLSIVDYGSTPPMINTTYFSNTASASYWSSTTDINLITSAFTVDFSGGDITILGKGFTERLRCVRSGV